LDARNTRQFPATGRVEGPTDRLTYTTTSVFLGGKVGSRAEKLLAEATGRGRHVTLAELAD